MDEIDEMDEINEYLKNTLKIKQDVWVTINVNSEVTNQEPIQEPSNTKQALDFESLYILILEAIEYAKLMNANKVMDMMGHLHNIEMIDNKLYLMIRNLLKDGDFNQVILVLNDYIFSL
jgi:KaiC/GvpD/RAD55 family RecA-like ATPase